MSILVRDANGTPIEVKSRDTGDGHFQGNDAVLWVREVGGGEGLVALPGTADDGLLVQVSSLPTGSAVLGRVGHDVTGIADGRKEIAVAGTPEALVGVSTPLKHVAITALEDNVGSVAVGAATVDASLGGRRGKLLLPGEPVAFAIDNLQDVFLDVLTNNDGVYWLGLS